PATTPTTPKPTPTTPISKITLQWGTASVGSAGYTGLALIADVVNRYMTELEISVMPTAGAVASIKGYASGELGGCYASTPSFTELYSLSGRFKGFTPGRWPVQTFWAYTNEVTIAIHQKNLGKIACWRDLKGMKIFSGPAGWDVGAALRAALQVLNITFEQVEIDWSMVPDALERDVIVATNIYTVGVYGLPDWARQAELSVPLAILNPCPDEVEVLKANAPALGIFEVLENYVTPKEVFSTDVKLNTGTKLTALRFYYGFHVGTEVPAEVVYKMLKVLEAHAKELAELNPMFRLLAEDFVGVQVAGIETNKDVPVHPGLAMFLKEKGVWKSEWKIAGS
ncbi:MAG: TAXI family TRAP transporter solute-binding subunit, partial [Zestosphaera sp.]